MKNLYKIEDELYIISDTENVNENCWIITDGRLVQVSYLLSNEVAKGYKVILTTNKLLIKDGIQAIDNEFLEWFVKNPSCKFVEVQCSGRNCIEEYGCTKEVCNGVKPLKIIIPKDEPKFQESIENQVKIISIANSMFGKKEEPKQETLEETAERLYPFEIGHGVFNRNYEIVIERERFIEGVKSDAARDYWFKHFEQEKNNTSKVTRVDVIQHSPPYNGRAYTNYNAKNVELRYQDDNRTLKIFLK